MTSDILPRRLHPAATIIDLVHHTRSFAFALIAIFASQGLARGGAVVAVVVVVATLVAVVHWRTTRYWVTDHTLHLASGVLSRKQQVIPASRISALDTSRGILQRLFGVVEVHVQVAGGSKKSELKLRAINAPDAEALRSALGHGSPGDPGPAAAAAAAAATFTPGVAGDPAGQPGPGAGTPPLDSRPVFTNPGAIPDSAPVVYSMTMRELLVNALTSPSIAVVAAASAAVFSVAQDALPERVQSQLADSVEGLTVTTAIAFVFLAVIVAAVISVIGTILMYGNFAVTKDSRRLRITRGLLTERVGTIPLDRIHGIRVKESIPRQMLGYASIEVEVAGYAGQDEITRTLIPLVRRSEVPALLERVVPGLVWPSKPLEVVPARARRRYLTIPLLFALPVAVALIAAPIGWFRVFAVVPFVLAIAQGTAAWKAAGWALQDGTLTIRWRGLGRSTLLATSARLQRTEQLTNPFQRRAALAHFEVRLSNQQAGRVRHLDDGIVHELLARTGKRSGEQSP